jgi:hypothetical protein
MKNAQASAVQNISYQSDRITKKQQKIKLLQLFRTDCNKPQINSQVSSYDSIKVEAKIFSSFPAFHSVKIILLLT